MCKIIYDDVDRENPGIPWNTDFIHIRTNYEGRHIIANDNLLHRR